MRDPIVAYINDPTPANWDACAHIEVAPGVTLLRAVRRILPDFPRGKALGPEPSDAGWTAIPSPRTVKLAMTL